MLRTKQIIGYNVSRNIVYFGTGFACFVGGHTGGPCPLQDKTGAGYQLRTFENGIFHSFACGCRFVERNCPGRRTS
jgi:hypothetical protein